MAEFVRGAFSDEVKTLAKYHFLGDEFTLRHYRLLPYIQYCLMNSERIDPIRVNDEERGIISGWREKGYISGGASEPLSCTKNFWDAMNAILFVGYVRNSEVDQ